MTNALTILPAPQLPTVIDQPIVVDELVTGQFGHFSVVQIRISKTNRKRFNQKKLEELAASIKAKGIAQPILIRPVEPTEIESQIYEIVAGERRFRAAIMAGLHAVPAMCRALNDQEALELQILENLQRDNPHPLEEAEGYERLMMEHGYSADQLVDKVNKSRSYVYGRLKLLALNLHAREVFLDNEDALPASTALLIARIPVPELQTKALNEVLRPNGLPGDEPMSVRRATKHIQDKYMLDLGRAVFPIKDAKLLADAGNCQGCMKRAGNQPEVYEGVHPNVCTDPDCFAEKTAAHYQRLANQARKAGIPVFEGEDAQKQYGDIYRAGSEYVAPETGLYTFERIAAGAGMHGTFSSRLAADKRPPVVAYIKEQGCVLMSLYKRADAQLALEANGICESAEAKETRVAATQGQDNQQHDEQDDEAPLSPAKSTKEARAAELTTERLALYRNVRPSLAGELPLVVLRTLTSLVLRDHALPDDLLADLYPFGDRSDEGVRAYIDTADRGEVQQLLCDLIIGDDLHINPWNIEEEETSEGHMALHAMSVALQLESQSTQSSVENGEQATDAAEQLSARPVLKLKPRESADEKSTEGPIIKVKKNRAVLAPAAAWPFPTQNRPTDPQA
jgi:ParB/RepB/Spo0J family partition protein